jgi:hypothetical protein
MSSKSKAIGTRAETKVARYLSDHGLPTRRKALAGSLDEGDLCMLLQDGTEVTVEVKAGKQTWNYNRTMLNEWLRQTEEEGKNSGCPAILVVVKYCRKFSDAEIWMSGKVTINWFNYGTNWWTGRKMFYIDEFTDWAKHAARVP